MNEFNQIKNENVSDTEDCKIEVYETELFEEKYETDRNYCCSICCLKFVQKSHLTRHLQCHKGINPFKCWKCPSQYKDKNSLYRHLLNNHSNEKVFQCRICEQHFSEQDFYSHQNTHREFSVSSKTYICRICLKSFLNGGDLKEHIKIHRGERPFRCAQCDKSFSRKDILRSHIRIHTGQGLFSCPKCQKKFHTKFNLDEHALIHNGVKSLQCTDCPKTFLRRSGLNRHMKIHGKFGKSGTPKKLPCPVCKKLLSRDINAHMKIHTNDRPFCCAECGKRFFHNCELNKHMMVHTGEKPYECSICAKRFSKSSNLRRHEQTHSVQGKPHWCPICSRTFHSSELLASHIANHTIGTTTMDEMRMGMMDKINQMGEKPELVKVELNDSY